MRPFFLAILFSWLSYITIHMNRNFPTNRRLARKTGFSEKTCATGTFQNI